MSDTPGSVPSATLKRGKHVSLVQMWAEPCVVRRGRAVAPSGDGMREVRERCDSSCGVDWTCPDGKGSPHIVGAGEPAREPAAAGKTSGRQGSSRGERTGGSARRARKSSRGKHSNAAGSESREQHAAGGRTPT